MNFTSLVSNFGNRDSLDVIIILLMGIICIMSLNCVMKVKCMMLGLVGLIIIAIFMNCICDVRFTSLKIRKKHNIILIVDLDSGKG